MLFLTADMFRRSFCVRSVLDKWSEMCYNDLKQVIQKEG